jgi:hypothetical protein
MGVDEKRRQIFLSNLRIGVSKSEEFDETFRKVEFP